MTARSCKNCKHQENCGALRPHRFGTKRDRSKFITSSSEDCKDWEEACTDELISAEK